VIIKKANGIWPLLSLFGFYLVMFGCKPIEEDLVASGPATTEEIDRGSNIFHVQCARCHGFEGAGSSAPSLQRSSLEHATTDEMLQYIIKNGIPGTEMPGSWVLTPPDVHSVAAYVKSLGAVEQEEPTGDLAAGKLIYLGKGGCPACHIIDGEGGSLGPDLSRVGVRQSAEFIKRSLLEPGFFKKADVVANTASGFVHNLMLRVKTKSGQQITAMRINEDAFNLQLRDAENNYYSLRKKDLLEVEKMYETSLMPSVKNTLSENELEDLVAYLVSRK